jgi:predicted secreted protein
MAVFALTNAYVTVNAVDLSDHCKQVTIEMEADQLDSTGFGSTGWRSYIGGLKQGTVAFEFMDDFASSSVDATLWGAFNTGTAVAVAVRPVNTTIATTNPEYQFNVLPQAHNLGGSVGDLAAKSLTYNLTGAVTRDTTP